ncbi:MAG TPA: M50 family metallopeptidase [Blastocatellia bacterium]|nr:M50 family metallopeptidase [Blastocatellia bacterium]
METQSEVKQSLRLLVLASLAALALWFIPLADRLTYPIRLFVTFIHETGHALAALATFGGVNRIAIEWSGSGVTETNGGWGLMISSAGYLATTIYGASLLLLLRRKRNVRLAAIGTGALLLLITVFFAGNGLAWATGLAFGAGCLLLAVKVPARLAHFLMSFLAVQCLLNAFYDLRTLLYLSVSGGAATDAQNMARATNDFIPAIVWAIGWSALSVLILAATLAVYYRSLRRREKIAEDPYAGLLTDISSKTANQNL